MDRYTYFGDSSVDPRGEFVDAEEALARIAALEALLREVEHTTKGRAVHRREARTPIGWRKRRDALLGDES